MKDIKTFSNKNYRKVENFLAETFTNFRITAALLVDTWDSYRDGRRLRCQLCGKFLMIGDSCRWILANGTGYNYGNFFVCFDCDEDDNSVVIDKAML